MPQQTMFSRWAPLSLTIVCAVIALPTLRFGLVNYDDPWLITDNHILQHLHISGIPALFTDLSLATRYTLGAEYLPIRDLSIALDFALFGNWFQGFHITQLLIHLLTIYSLARLLLTICDLLQIPQFAAISASAIWALHPLHVESLCWISERKGMLAAAFVVLTARAWLHHRRYKQRRYLVIACTLAACAIASKATALFGVASIGAIDLLWHWRAHRMNWPWLRSSAALGLVAALAFAPVFYTASHAKVILDDEKALALSTSSVDNATTGKLPMAVGLIGHYTISLSLARPPSLTYPISHKGPASADYAIGIVVLLLGAATSIAAYRRRNIPVLACVIWSALCFMPFSRLLFPIQIIAADRYMLLPLLGPSALLGYALASVQQLRIAATVSIALVALLGILSIKAQDAWSSSLALFSNAVDRNPGLADGWLRLSANVYSASHNAQAAEEILDRGLLLNPQDASLILKKSNYRAAQNDLAGAQAWLRKGAAFNYARSMDKLSQLLASQHRAESITWAERAVAKRPDVPAFRKTLADAYTEQGNTAAAVATLQALTAMAPVAESFFELGKALWRAGDIPAAKQAFARTADSAEFSAAADAWQSEMLPH
jgi:protein O-mannosyl-transferase